MRYRRVLIVTELGADATTALAAARGFAPDAESLVIVVCPPEGAARVAASAPDPCAPEADAGAVATLARLREAASTFAASLEIGLVPDLDPDALHEVVAAARAELVIAGPLPLHAIAILSDLRKRRPIAILWLGAGTAPREGPPVELLCVALGGRAEASIARFLRDHCDRSHHVTMFSLARSSPWELTEALRVSGVEASVELVGAIELASRGLEALVYERAVDLVVVPRFPALLLRSGRSPVPVLILPPPVPARLAVRRPLDVCDLLDDGGVLRARLAYAYSPGRNAPIADQEVAFVASGRTVAVVTTRHGDAELPARIEADSLGVFRVDDSAPTDPLDAVERRVGVVRAGHTPLVLFDVELPDADLAALARASKVELLAVRLRPVRSCQTLRDRLRKAGLAPRVVDASAVLDEGEALDVGGDMDPVRLARVAARMRRAGYPIVAIVPLGPHLPRTTGFAALRARELEGTTWEPLPGPEPRRSLPESGSLRSAATASIAAALDARTGAETIPGNEVELELDNALARRWLLDAIEGARARVHLQTYMATDDAVGRQVEGALRDAGGRGVAVRVLVDSLHGLHGSFGMQNPLLERLSASPGVELRVSRPVAGLPSLEELKQRDHRKLVVVDGAVALLGGRNLASEYYTGFDEVPLTADTPWRDVPWLDAGARLRGPAVAAVEHAFREAWADAGGDSFEVEVPKPAGAAPARVVVHRGLLDAATLEAYLSLIDGARSHLYVVNGFPLLLELQHALVRAARRGVRVRTLFGHVTPTHGSTQFAGDWMARSVATSLVHSRMDALVAAGCEGYLLALRGARGWAPGLGAVHPHVHAKALSADGLVLAVGSANLDVTASYWESELLLVAEDPSVAGAFEARIDAILAESSRVQPDDPAWQRLARRREWLRYWPGVLSV